MKKINHGTIIFFAVLIFLSLIPISYGHAAGIREVTMDEMLQESQFVFEGRVVAITAQKNNQNRIHTYVTFEIEEIIKGTCPRDTITLSFLGGTVGEETMAVSDMAFPQVGEHGIYFVESLERSQVHPLYGWSQGHFLVERDSIGMDRVMTHRKQPVTEVTGDMVGAQMNYGISKGMAHALTVDEFKKGLRERLGGGSE